MFQFGKYLQFEGIGDSSGPLDLSHCPVLALMAASDILIFQLPSDWRIHSFGELSDLAQWATLERLPPIETPQLYRDHV